MRFIDIGANLTDPVFRGIYRGKHAHPDDFSGMLERAARAGVERIIVTGGSLSESRAALKLARSHDSLFSTVGCHPTRSQEFDKHPGGPDKYLSELLSVVTSPDAKGNVVAIGECGLDYDRLHFSPKDVQLRHFEQQFSLAEQTGLPMFLHSRNTGTDFIDVVRRNRHRFTGGVVHSFTGELEEMEQLVATRLHIGVNGCSLKTEANLEVVKRIPESSLVIETDCPYCDVRQTHASHAYLGSIPKARLELYQPPTRKKERFEQGLAIKGRNEPCTIGQVLHVVASVRGADPEQLAQKIYENTTALFFHQETAV